jgi:peptide/nickel transport system substrate-binding protein
VLGSQLIASGENYGPFPMTSFSVCSTTNFEAIQLSTLPAYWFGDPTTGAPTINYPLSVANPPTFSNGDQTITISLKNWVWSDGTPVTSRDVSFWLNILKAAVKASPSNYCAYVPTQFPDNLASWTTPNSSTIVLNMNKQTNQQWLLYNELSQLYPIPQHAWDKTSLTGAVGNYDQTPAGALQVYNFINKQASSLATLGTNPMWKVADGPYEFSSPWSANCQPSCTFVKNAKYSGSPKPYLDTIEWKPFTTDTSEFTVLSSPGGGGLTEGFVPIQDISLLPKIEAEGYRVLGEVPGWQVNYAPYNFGNTTLGPVFKQLYFRQAFQSVIDQNTYIQKVGHGKGSPTYGPVPVQPPNPFADTFEKSNPYPFSISHATSLLSSNGWKINASGADTCTNPGTGAGQCGAGIAAGTALSITLKYASGIEPVLLQVTQLQSDAAKAGIQLHLLPAPFTTVISEAVPTNTKWQIDWWGGGWIYAPDYYPSGEVLFLPGAAANSGNYNDPTANALIKATNYQPGSGTMSAYEDYIAKQLPWVFMPIVSAGVLVVKTNLAGSDPSFTDSLTYIYPQYWYFTKP